MTRFLAPLCALIASFAAPAADSDPYGAARNDMVATVRAEAHALARALGARALDERVLTALARVPRHEFVPEEWRGRAYQNRPLPIGYGQTISQPYIVALMTDLLDLGEGARVLEIGTGSGYQAAILAELGVEVFTIEIIPPLAKSAHERLQRLGYRRVRTHTGDGYHGWAEHAPYDAIIVTAAANHIPPPLLEQLKPGGRMVIPVGNPFGTQHLYVATKDRDGRVTTEKSLAVRFVPLTGER
jgi:protein-L-isoaspartate(D-aspartate) O-methyltransferase